MNERASPAYFSSVVLHGLAVAVIILLAYVSSQSTPNTEQVMQLVAGPGSNYMGTEATKLGSETGEVEIKVPFTPAAPAPAPTPPAPTPEPQPAEVAPATPAEPVPVAPAPVAKPIVKPTKSTVKPLPNPMLNKVKHGEIVAESREKMRAAKAEKARKKALAEAKAQETYSKFLASQGGAAQPKGRSGGVAAGTTMADGAGGKALTAAQVDAIAAWKALLRQRWIDGFVPPSDFDQKMVATVKFHVTASGSVMGIHVIGSTGGAAFESAVADALRHVTMPPYPAKHGEDFEVPFSLQDNG